MVSMLPTVDSNVRAISGGNYQLAERLVKLSQAVLYLSEQILAVRKKGSKFMLDAKVGFLRKSYQKIQFLSD